MSFKDKHIPCKDCGGEFVFTAGEQEFYAQKGFTNEPQFDVYVHGSLFSQVRRSLQEGDQISVTVEASDRGPRARTFDLR